MGQSRKPLHGPVQVIRILLFAEETGDPILHRFGYPAEERKYVMMFYLSGITAVNEVMYAKEKGIEVVITAPVPREDNLWRFFEDSIG